MVKQGVKVICTDTRKFKFGTFEKDKLEIMLNEVITELNNNNCRVVAISNTTVGGTLVPITSTILYEYEI